MDAKNIHNRASGQPKTGLPTHPRPRITTKMPLFPLFSGISGAVPTLDLHGMRVRPALDATRDFLAENQASGAEQVRIIYGKGRGTPGGLGVLRQAVPAWIEQNATEWVERFERDLDASGNDGAMRIWLRPPDPSAAD